MKKIFTYFLGFGLPLAGINQTAFTPGNLVVVQVGSGGAALTNKSAPISLVEINPTTTPATVVQTIQLPYTTAMATGGNNRIVAQGSSSNEANLTISANGSFFIMTGHNADTGIATISGVAGTNRTLARIAMSGIANTSTLMDTTKSKGNARCAASNDGTGFWYVGNTGGVKYVPFGCTGLGNDTAVLITPKISNLRTIQPFGGNLIVGDGSGTISRVGKLNGFPTIASSADTIAPLPGISLTLTANSIYMTSLPGGPAGLNTLYLADDGGNPSGIKKYSLNGSTGNWDSTGIMDAASNYRAMTGVTTGSTVALSAVKSGSPLNAFVDATGYGVAPTAAPIKIMSAPTNTAFRGVQVVPVSLPIQLLSFNATKNDAGNAKVWWVIASETNVANYVVEKSVDSKNFNTVATIKAAHLNNYEFTDSKVLDVTTYYRVKFVDNDGTFKYSNVVAVTPKKSIKLEVFPNPVKSNLIVSYPKTTVVSNVRITTLDGKTLVNQAVQQGTTQINLDVANLQSGNYIIVFNDAEGNITTQKFVK